MISLADQIKSSMSMLDGRLNQFKNTLCQVRERGPPVVPVHSKFIEL